MTFMPQPCRLLYITAADREEAEKIARALLEDRLIACANLLSGMTSFYWWEGVIRQAGECVLIVKTTQELENNVMEKIKSLHSYDCPCILSMAVESGNPEFLAWIAGQVCEPA